MSDKITFEEEFRLRTESIFARGKAVGLSISEICKRSKVARATPDRWKKSAPLSVTLVDKMEAEVAAAEAAAGK